VATTEVKTPMYGWFLLGNNVAGIFFNMIVLCFFAAIAIGIGLLVYAAKELKKREVASTKVD
jgi:ABC-type multidrug transport system permease subunit